MDIKEISLEDLDRINLVQNRNNYQAYVNTVMSLRVP